MEFYRTLLLFWLVVTSLGYSLFSLASFTAPRLPRKQVAILVEEAPKMQASKTEEPNPFSAETFLPTDTPGNDSFERIRYLAYCGNDPSKEMIPQVLLQNLKIPTTSARALCGYIGATLFIPFFYYCEAMLREHTEIDILDGYLGETCRATISTATYVVAQKVYETMDVRSQRSLNRQKALRKLEIIYHDLSIFMARVLNLYLKECRPSADLPEGISWIETPEEFLLSLDALETPMKISILLRLFENLEAIERNLEKQLGRDTTGKTLAILNQLKRAMLGKSEQEKLARRALMTDQETASPTERLEQFMFLQQVMNHQKLISIFWEK